MRIARHTLFNLLGLGGPMAFALFSIPALMAGLGEARFGLLTLVWAVTSYFGLFDLGLSRALTQRLAIVLDQGPESEAGPLSATALILMAVLGLAGGAIMAIGAPWGVAWIRGLTSPEEAIAAVRVMGAALPFIVVTAGLRGMLEARHAFGVLNAIRLPMGLWTFVGPWLVLAWAGPDLYLMTWVLAAGRVVACLVHAWYVWRALPMLKGQLRWAPHWLQPLLTSGGWLTLSNLVSPFMGYVDRFMIGAVVSATAVAYYATPQEMVTKLWIIPGALTAVLFPAFAAGQARSDGEVWQLFDRALALLALVLWPVTVALALFAHELLALWINPGFAAHAGPILQIFAVGIFINCLAHLPLTWLQGAGHFRAPALLHVAELPLFVLALWWMGGLWGLQGAALAWLARMVLDALILFVVCARAGGRAPGWLRHHAAQLALACLPFAGLALDGLAPRVALALAVLVLAALLGRARLRSVPGPL